MTAHTPHPLACDPDRRAWCVAAAAWPLGTPAAASADRQDRRETLDPQALRRLDAAVLKALQEGRLPGGVVRLELGSLVHEQAWGWRAEEPTPQPMDLSAVFDVASLTKVVVTAPLVMQLIESGALQLSDPVRKIVPEFQSHDEVTLMQLLTHTSGLPAGLPLSPTWKGREAALQLACTRALTHAPGTFFRYSDVNFILLGEVVQRVAAKPLEVLAQERLFSPLNMRDSGFLPLQRVSETRLVPTEWVTEETGLRMLRGEVHDPTARRMGGVAGHAGLFSTVADLSRFARMVLGGGELDGVRVLQEATVRRMCAVSTPASVPERRALGWDVDSPFSRARGRRYPLGSVGHTGFTGCAMWLDPASHAFHVWLSNRVHPRTRESIVALYEDVATAAAEAMLGSR